jgi:SAM-dependent methyltransferase
MAGALYDEYGRTYGATRRADPRWEAAISEALGDARTVLNVGAGTGNYEPRDRDVVAVEPSEVMIAQRPRGAARVVRAHAEDLPFADAEFEVSMAVLSDHHWGDRARGLRELRRVARRSVVLTYDPSLADAFWFTRDYLPGFKKLPGMTIDEVSGHLGGAEARVVPVPHDCRDGFYPAFWRRPRAYLDERVRAGISIFHRVDSGLVDAALERLRADLASGEWRRRNADVLDLDEIDLGFRLLIAG